MIRVEALGGLRMFRDGEELSSLSAKPVRAALLAYLAVEGREVSREQLCAYFWPESSPERARHSLSQTLYELRKELGSDWVKSEGERLAVTDVVRVDVRALLSAAGEARDRDTLEAYRGPFLDGVLLGGGVDFEHWVEDKRSEIHRAVRRALRALASSSHDPRERVRLARDWVGLDPLDDEGHHALIEALAVSGDRSGALDQYRSYAELIAAELDVEPLDHTKELVERIKAGDVLTGPGGLADAGSGTAAPTEGRAADAVHIAPGLVVSRLIGRGATGAVYLAREPALRRLVAVKVLDAEMSKNPVARARFEREAQAAARIVDANVTPVYQVGTTEDDRPYLVMPYVKGGTLADRMKARGAFPVEEVRVLLEQAASALAAAHAVGVLHRDVRPGNFLYEEARRRTYLADFGIAGVLESGTEEIAHLTRTGELLGNVEYISPEQAHGDELDDRSDVYSLGVLGWALLSGGAATPDAVPETVADPELIELLERATSKEPRHRPSARDFLGILTRTQTLEATAEGGLYATAGRLLRRILPGGKT